MDGADTSPGNESDKSSLCKCLALSVKKPNKTGGPVDRILQERRRGGASLAKYIVRAMSSLCDTIAHQYRAAPVAAAAVAIAPLHKDPKPHFAERGTDKTLAAIYTRGA